MDVRLLSRVPVERSLRSVASAAARLLSQELDLSEFDGLLVVCEGLGDLVALRQRRIPVFCLCLTPLRIAFDPVYRKRYLASRSVLHRLVVRAGTVLYRGVDRIAWRRYRRIFAISEEVKTRILAGRLAPAEKMRTLHPGVELSAYTPSPPAERTFFVPGRIMWTKNLELAIQAFQLFRMTAPEPSTWKLVIAGIVDRKSGPYLDRLRSLASGDPSVEFRVHPSDTQMRALYAACFATLFTAFNEDWGLVLIEAMASGKPAVAVNRGGPKEIVRHEHDGLLSEPDPEEFAAAMGRLAERAGALRAPLLECSFERGPLRVGPVRRRARRRARARARNRRRRGTPGRPLEPLDSLRHRGRGNACGRADPGADGRPRGGLPAARKVCFVPPKGIHGGRARDLPGPPGVRLRLAGDVRRPGGRDDPEEPVHPAARQPGAGRLSRSRGAESRPRTSTPRSRC